MVAATRPAASVRRLEQRLRLDQVEVADVVVPVALGGNVHHLGDDLRVLGMLQRGVAVEGADRGESVVARADAVAPVLFEVGEKRADQRRLEVIEVQLEWRLAGLLVREAEQQPDRVTVGRDRVRLELRCVINRSVKNACRVGATRVMTAHRGSAPDAH